LRLINLIIFFLLYTIFVFSQKKEYTELVVDSTWISKVEQMPLNKSEKQINKEYYYSYADIYQNFEQEMYNPYSLTLEFYIEKYSNYSWFPKIIALSEFYFPLIEDKLIEYGLPNELKFLPIIESNMNPRAISHVGASGLWQFMPATGKMYGLVSDDNTNLFFDPVASTDAACKYLKYLYKMFEDWNLVLAAYNAGPGNVRKAIRKAKSSNYQDIEKFLPKETRAYIPSFHAVKFLYSYPEIYSNTQYNLAFDYSNLKLNFTEKSLSYNTLIKQLEDSPSLFNYLNPHLISYTIPKGSYYYTYN
jgi:membrane-bound lytic murein transglycosylase D